MQVRSKLLFSFVLLGMLCAGMMVPSAYADDITVDGVTYDLAIVDTSFTASAATLETTPWYGNEYLAENIAVALDDDVDPTNEEALQISNVGPLLAWDVFEGEPYAGVITLTNILGFPDDLTSTGAPINTNLDYVEGSIVPTPAPEPSTYILIFSGLLGLGLLVAAKHYRQNHLPTTA